MRLTAKCFLDCAVYGHEALSAADSGVLSDGAHRLGLGDGHAVEPAGLLAAVAVAAAGIRLQN